MQEFAGGRAGESVVSISSPTSIALLQEWIMHTLLQYCKGMPTLTTVYSIHKATFG